MVEAIGRKIQIGTVVLDYNMYMLINMLWLGAFKLKYSLSW